MASGEVKSAVANAVRRRVNRQLRAIGTTLTEVRRGGDTPRVACTYRSYHRSKDTRSLVPRTDLRGPRRPRTDARVVDLFMESLVEAADKEPAWSIGDVETRLEKKLELENFSRPLCDYLRCPSKSTLYRLFDRVDEYDVAILKEGKASADRRFKITKTGVPKAPKRFESRPRSSL